MNLFINNDIPKYNQNLSSYSQKNLQGELYATTGPDF